MNGSILRRKRGTLWTCLSPCMEKDVCPRQQRCKWVCKCLRGMSVLNEWQRRMTVMCHSNAGEEPIGGLSLECFFFSSWIFSGKLQCLRSLWPRTVQTIVSVWHLTGSASSPSGVFPGPRGGEADVSLALLRWCAMRDQEPAPSGPWSGSAYWT